MSVTRQSGDRAEFALDRLSQYGSLDESDRALVGKLAAALARRRPGAALLKVLPGRPALSFIVSGWAIRTRGLPDGRRQIYSFLLPGDVVASRSAPSGWSHTMVEALTPMETLDFTGHRQIGDGSTLAAAFAASLAEEEALILDQVTRLGQRDAYGRAIDLLVELHRRLAAASLAAGDRFTVPVGQDQLAEALGVTAVHVRRILQRMKGEDLLAVKSGRGLALHAERLLETHRRVSGGS